MKNFFYVSPSHDGWHNLAVDEWLLDNIGEDELILYLYVNRNAVIIGKNQNPWKECNLAAMESDEVQLVRRITGGGAVFHDTGNLNFSFIAGKSRYDTDKQFGMIMQTLRALGIPCEFSGRNDLLSDGKKFSGNAFCARGNNCQHHGTLLINADMTRLQNYLQVDPRKLQAKGVASVRSRVCNLTELQANLNVPIMVSSLKQSFRKVYGDYVESRLNEADLAAIKPYYEKHSSWDWRIGRTPKFDIELDNRFAWGGIQLLLTLREGKIETANVYSDAIDAELPALLTGLLEGQKFSARDLSDALSISENEQVRDIADWLASESL